MAGVVPQNVPRKYKKMISVWFVLIFLLFYQYCFGNKWQCSYKIPQKINTIFFWTSSLTTSSILPQGVWLRPAKDPSLCWAPTKWGEVVALHGHSCQDWSVGWYEKPWDPRSSCWDIQYVRLVQGGIPTSQNSWKQGKFNPPSLELADDKVYDPATGKLVRLDAWELRDGGTQRCRTGCPFSLSEWCKDGSSATLSHWTNESLKKKVWNMSYVCEFVVVSMFHVILIPIQNDSWFSAGPWILLGSTIWGWNARLFGWVKRDLQFVPWTRDNRGTYWWFNACDFGVHARQRTECLDVGMKCGTLKTPSIIGRESQKRCVWQQMIMQLKSCMKNGNDAFLQGTASQILMMRTCVTIMMTETSEICRFRGRIARSLFVPNLFDIYLASLRPFPFAGYMFAFMKDYRGRSQQQVFNLEIFLI